MDRGALALTGLSAGPCDGYTMPAVVACLASQSHAAALQKWLAATAHGFEPVEIMALPPDAPAAAAGVKRERGAAVDDEHEDDDQRQARSVKLKHDSQGGWTAGYSMSGQEWVGKQAVPRWLPCLH